MKTKFQLAALLLGLATINSPLSSCFAQGGLTPPGAPAVTMKTLDQIYARGDARISITNSASMVTISSPGSYYLTTNLTVSSGDGIIIATNGVTLDLNGYTISSTAASAAGYAIKLTASSPSDITIGNGHIRSGVTNNGSGVYSGSGFSYGIYYSGGFPANVLAARVSVAGCRYYGIYLGTGSSTVVENCTVQTVGGSGIVASTIKQSIACDCGSYAILGDQVADCRGESTGSYGLYASTAQNCYGSSVIGYGLYATTAQNCYGYSTSVTGLTATTAQNCYGTSTSGNGLYAATAQNCYGETYGIGYGLSASKTATGCFGYSSSGTGLYAFIANVCSGSTSSGTALSTSHNVNSF